MAGCCSNTTCRGHIPVEKIIRECDRFFNEEKTAELGDHLRFWCRRAGELGDKKGQLSMLNELIGHYRMGRDDVRGPAAVEEALALIKELNIETALSAGTIFLNAATALQSFGESSRAAGLYRRAELCYKTHLPPQDERFAGLYNNMAPAFMDMGDFDKAEKYYLLALSLLKDNPMDRAVTHINLARLYDALDPEDPRIETHLEQAFACFETTPVDGYYAHTCRKCAPVFGYFGRFADEAELNRKAGVFYGKS